ncbi:LacI family DNA-binding transcriptional regulator [Nostocoides sp. F2B08]|uniref:LacI family DNA-binding transcriptional regulator n=1 Tax=Nostocoides sp. F2B08 TaxID=2653936 RepID=UPI00210406DE|nr:LacI family DNA-binding transcriptional regulator [Tetrasphaera sp. F2B08]
MARRAGVSLATASRAINDSYGVSTKTRGRVLAAAEELAYVVSPEASRLAGGRTGRVGLVVPHIDRWFFGTLVAGAEGVLGDAGLDVLLFRVGDADDRRDFFHRLPARRKIDGLIVVGFPVLEAERERLDLLGVSIVSAGGQQEAYPYACVDDYEVGTIAVTHLLNLGHRRIAMIEAIDPDQPGWPTLAPRSAAYHDALDRAGIRSGPGLVCTVPWGGEAGADAMAQLLSRAEPPTAVYAHSDEIAVGAIRTARRAGLDVPGDISVVGIDDHPIAALTDLTTVAQPVRAIGERAAATLLEMIDGQHLPSSTTFPAKLVVRRSTAPPAVGARD